MNRLFLLGLFFFLGLSYSIAPLDAQPEQADAYDQAYFDALEWRPIGPFRGGRSCTVTGVPGQPNLYYFGSTGGGVWRTKNGGQHWENISDGFFGGSIGAVAVSTYDPNVIYVGTGEQTLRGNVSSGNGLWKSVDAGATWTHIGLEETRHIGRVRIHPKDPNTVYVAAIGNIYKPHEDRGVFRTTDGGKTWEKILYVNDEVGAVDLLLDPNNPRILYATTWRVKRTPYDFSSGGPGSGIWKSTDGGESWEDISTAEGLPGGTLGIIGVAVSPANSNRVWAMVEAKEGGLFRSEDGGKTFRKINEKRKLRQRAWYYTRIYADPVDEDVMYVMNVRWHKSKDGGKTFETQSSPHGDHHDLWVAPEDPNRMIIGDDGGAQVSYDGGQNWSTYHNQATAQFYRVTTDDAFPFRIYAAQQDNSTVRIPHRTQGGSITDQDWEPTAGCECGHLAIDPRNPDIVYGGCYDGLLERRDHSIDQQRNVSVWPDNPMGHGAEGMKYRFQWNFPIFISPHDPNKLYAASNHLHVSTDEGQSWEIVSPDLTRNDPSKLGPSGGPITKDNTSVEYYCTIFAALESPRVKDLLWAGSDDGLIHISKDGGQNWEDVTPPSLPEWALINSIEADPFTDGGLYVAATRYKMGDFEPYLFKTKDFGKTWTRINQGIADEHFTRVVRADPKRRGLLYAGTEAGVYASFDDGAHWQPLQLNLPIVPITDLAVKEDHLIAATQGRSIWILDDVTPLHQISKTVTNKAVHLYQPADAYRMPGYHNTKVKNAGVNRPNGTIVYYYLNEIDSTTEVKLSFFEEGGELIKTFSNQAEEKGDKLEVEAGSNRFVWNMQYPKAKDFEGMILWWASLNGPKAVPGNYQVKLEMDGKVQESTFKILKDPRTPVSQADIQAQFDFIQEILDKTTEAHEAIGSIQEIRKQMKRFTQGLDPEKQRIQALLDKEQEIDSILTDVEETLYQTKNESPQDPLNFPIRLTNKLAHLNSAMSSGDYPPTEQAIVVKNELIAAIDAQLQRFQQVVEKEVPEFNRLVHALEVDAIQLKEE
jgi:photosystem II stability/assembly factor-like uncharacterized protein